VVDQYGAIGNGERHDELVGVDPVAGGFKRGHDPGVRCGWKFGVAKRGRNT
jgi:hypothetical protein